MDNQGQVKAINAYTKFLQTKGISVTALNSRTKFIQKLISLLEGNPDRTTYGKALQTIIKIEDSIDRQQQLNYAREFYPFLMGDIKSIARISDTYGFDLTSAKFKTLPAKLEWPEIDAINEESFTKEESKLLRDYAVNLQQQHLTEEALQEKLKLVKLMLLRLRDIPVENSMAYRMAVDVTLPLFNLEDIKQGFLSAVREFYYIWSEKEADTKKAAGKETA